MTALLIVVAALAALLAAVPEGGTDVLAPAGGGGLPSGLAAHDEVGGRVTAEGVEVPDGPDGGPARVASAVVTEGTARPWDVQLTAPTAAPVAEGDALLLEVYVRGKSDLGAEAATEVVFEQRGEPWEKFGTAAVTAGPGGWTRVLLPMTASRDLPAGGGQVAMRLGYGPQRVEVAGLRVLNYGRDRRAADLPRTAVAYEGMADDAPWRAEAAARIDALRKGDLTVRVVDRRGEPVAGVEVGVEMTRHAFDFGTAVEHDILFADTPDGARYRETLLGWFNYATPENELKQNVVEERGIERALETVAWLNDRGIRVRGHNLLWPGWHRWFLPARVREGYAERLSTDPAHARRWLAAELGQHLVAKAAATRGRVVGWDVANEVANNREVMEALGDDDATDAALAGWFGALRAVDPRAEAYLNDYGILVDGGRNRALIGRYLRQIENLKAAGQAPDAVGVQCHFGTGLTGPGRAWEVFDELHAAGVPVEVTEFDVTTGDEALDGRFARDFLTAAFAHEGVRAFVVWGFWEERHWRPASAFFRSDWSLRPTGEAWRDLVLGEWWTRETPETGPDGTAAVRGFLGDYRVTVGGETVETTLARGGREVLIEVD